MKSFKVLTITLTAFAVWALPLAYSGSDEDAARDRVKIEKVIAGGAKVTVVTGTDTAAAVDDKGTARKTGEDVERGTALAVPHKARLAVLPAIFSKHFQPQFKFSEKIETSGRVDLKMVFTTEHEMRWEAPSFTLSMVEAFVGSRKFDVLERARLDETLREVDFGESDYADVARVVPVGKALNAEYVVLPEIEVVDLVEEVKDIPYVDHVRPKLKGKMIVRSRVVDTATTKVVAVCTEEVQVERKLKDNDPFLASEIVNLVMDLYRAGSMRLLYRTLETIYPVRLLEVAADKVVVNRGEGSIIVGDQFDVFAMGKAYVDPDTRETLGQGENRIAQIRVTKVLPKFSEAEIVEGADQLRGDVSSLVCRETAASIETKTKLPETPMAW